MDLLNHPLTYIVILTAGGFLIKGLFWLRDVDHVKNGWQTFTKEIRDDIKQILLRLPPPRPIASGSPARLTEYGLKIAEFLRAKDWAASVATTVAHEVVNKQPFQIEAFSRDYVETKLDPEIKERVAACAYEFGPNEIAWSPYCGSCCETSFYREEGDPMNTMRTRPDYGTAAPEDLARG